MEDYKKMYFRLFNRLTDTITALTAMRDNLMEAQQQSEEQFLSQEENESV